MRPKGRAVASAFTGVALVAALVVSAAMVRERTKLAKIRGAVSAKSEELKRAYDQENPFPSVTNVDAIARNRDALAAEITRLSDIMGRDQFMVGGQEETLDPENAHLGWLTSLTSMKTNLAEQAQEKGIVLPLNFSFGFPKYDVGGSPPAIQDVPRLSLQLRIVRSICQVLYSRGIKELCAIERQAFEGQPPPDARPFSELYDTESLKFSFKAKESAIIDVLNGLASSEMYIVMKDVTISAPDGIDIGKQSRSGEEREDMPAEKPRVPGELLWVSGPRKESPAEVTVSLDVYRFLKKSAAEGKEAKQ